MFLFCLVLAMPLCASVYMCLVVTCWERTHLWHKLLNHHKDYKMFKIVHNLYDNAKSCVRVGHRKSSLLSAILVSNGKKICLLYCFHCF